MFIEYTEKQILSIIVFKALNLVFNHLTAWIQSCDAQVV